MDRAIEERVSGILMGAVDSLGYSDVCIRTRQALYREFYRRNQLVPRLTFIPAGSKAEGTSLLYESDSDAMASLNGFVCSDNIHRLNTAEYKAVFHMETQNVPAGYTRLRYIDIGRVRRMARVDPLLNNIYQASLEYNGGHYLSSTLMFPSGMNRSGPAGTAEEIENTLGNCKFKIDVDSVCAIPCHKESMLQDWINRPRRHGWPSREVIQRISTLQGHVVPVGVKGSDDEFMQWRICYTPAEIALVHELNHVQAVLYVIMKMISKQLLKPVCPDITSYIIKNIILWMAELLPQHSFTENNLLSVLMDCLKFLREAVKYKFLANYILSKRNLFSGKLGHQEQKNLCGLLSTMIGQGPRFLVQYPELGRLAGRMQLVYSNPISAVYEQINRERREICTYRGSVGVPVDVSIIPFVVPLLWSCIQQGYPNEFVKLLVQRLFLYLNGYYDFQHVTQGPD